MSNTKLLALKHAIYEMGLRFNQEPSDAKITVYAKDLMNYTPEQVAFAFRQVINSGSSFFPSMAEILKHLRPAEDKREDRAPLLVKEIVQLIRSWHPHLEAQMLEHASPDARLVFKAIGNTADIRDSESFEIMNAQVERFVKGVLAAKESDAKNEKLQSIGIQAPGQVLGFPKKEMKSVNFQNFLDEVKS
jgi:hypothetical protein